jgi:hypothetical protein
VLSDVAPCDAVSWISNGPCARLLAAWKAKEKLAEPPAGTVTCAVCGDAVRPAGNAPRARSTVPLKPPREMTDTPMNCCVPLMTNCCGKLGDVLLKTRKLAGPTALKNEKHGPLNEFAEFEQMKMPWGWLATAVATALTVIVPGEEVVAVKLPVTLTPGGGELQQIWKKLTVPVKPFCGVTDTV